MAESYVQVPSDSSGKQLRTWLSGSKHSEAVVLTLADASNTWIDPRDLSRSGSNLIRWGGNNEPEWILGTGSSIPLQAVGTQVWTKTVSANKTGSIYGYVISSTAASQAIRFDLYSGSTLQRMLAINSTNLNEHFIYSSIPLLSFSGSTNIRILGVSSITAYVNIMVLYGEDP